MSNQMHNSVRKFFTSSCFLEKKFCTISICLLKLKVYNKPLVFDFERYLKVAQRLENIIGFA